MEKHKGKESQVQMATGSCAVYRVSAGFAFKGLAVGSGGFFKSAIRCRVPQGLNGYQHHVGYV